MSGYLSPVLIPEVASMLDKQDFLVKPLTIEKLKNAIFLP